MTFNKNRFQRWTAIGQGSIDYPSVLVGIKPLSTLLPLTVDLPLSLCQKDGAPAVPQETVMGLDEIDRILGDSRDFIMKYLSTGE